MSTRERYKAELEALLDGGHSVADILAMLSEVCGDKAGHLLDNWQDDAASRQWSRVSKALDRISAQSRFNFPKY